MKKGRKKVIPSYFQKNADSLSSILQAGSYQRKIKQVLQKNKEFARENETLKVDLAHSTKSLQRCTNYNTRIMLAKKKLEALVSVAHTLTTGLKEVADFLDMKEFLFMNSSDEEGRKLKLPPQALEPIDEVNSSVIEEFEIISGSNENTPVVEPQRTPVTRTSEARKSKTPVINLPETPNVADTSSSSLGTPVLYLSPLPVKRPLISKDKAQGRPPKRPKTPEKAARDPSPRTCKSMQDKPKKSPGKTPPSKKSPKQSKIPTRFKNPLPEPSIAFLPLSPPASRKTFVVRKEDNDNALSSRLRRETFKINQIPIDNMAKTSADVPSPRNETGNNMVLFSSEQTRIQNTNFGDDMEITSMLPLCQPVAASAYILPSTDDMELTAVVPIQCLASIQKSAVPSPPKELPRADAKETLISTSERIKTEKNALSRKKSLRVKKSMGVKEADENCQPSSKRLSLDDAALNARRKSVQFSFNECYNAFQSIKTKTDCPRSILKQPALDSDPSNQKILEPPSDPEPSKSVTPEPQKDSEPSRRETVHPLSDTKPEVPKAPLASVNFSSSDDSILTPTLAPDLFSEKCLKGKRTFSGVSERRSKKKTISGGDVFNEIQVFEETEPDSFAPGVPKSVKRSLHKTSQQPSKKPPECAGSKNASKSKDALEVSAKSDEDSFVISSPKKSPLRKKECAELEEPNAVEVSKRTDLGGFVPAVQNCAENPGAKISASRKKKTEIVQVEELAGGSDGLREIEDIEESGKDCHPPPGAKSKRKFPVKVSRPSKKKSSNKSTDLDEAKHSALTLAVDSKAPPAEPKKGNKKSRSKTQEDLEKVEVDMLCDPERSGSIGRGRRCNASAKSYKEPSLNCKMRREK